MEAAQYRLTEAARVDLRRLGYAAGAAPVLASPWPGATSPATCASPPQCRQKSFGIAHPPGRFLHWIVVVTLAILALIPYHEADALHFAGGFNAVLQPGSGTLWVLVQKVPSAFHLFFVEFTHES